MVLQIGLFERLFVFLQLTLGFDEFSLEGTVLFLTNLTFLELLIDLGLDVLEAVELLSGSFNLVVEHLLLLRPQLNVMGVKFELLFDVLELTAQLMGLTVHVF